MTAHNFNLKIDQLGIREVILIDNEAGCPYQCNGCGVKDAEIVSPETNRQVIDDELAKLTRYRTEESDLYRDNNSHVLVYNSGNVTSERELSRDNLDHLLHSLNKLEPRPSIVTLNSRGDFVTDDFLDYLQGLNLNYRVDFDFGLETRTERGKEIYGKQGIDDEFDQLFERTQQYNAKHGSDFGLMVNFVYLPEFYLAEGESREGNEQRIHQGFVDEISSFIDEYVNKGVALRINLNAFYQVDNLPYENSSLDDFMESAQEIWRIIAEKNKQIDNPDMKVSAFIGLQDQGYETAQWREQIQRLQSRIDEMNLCS